MTTEPTTATNSTVVSLLIIDAVLIIIFAMLGIASHDGALTFSSVLRVAIPFLAPYLILAGLIKPTKLIHNIFPMGIVVWLATVVLGPVLRAALFNDTSAMSFILVTAGVLGVFLLGRRIISTLVTRRVKTA